MSIMTPYPLNLEDDLDSLKDYECQRNVAAVAVADFAVKLFHLKSYSGTKQEVIDETMENLRKASEEYLRKRNAFEKELEDAFDKPDFD